MGSRIFVQYCAFGYVRCFNLLQYHTPVSLSFVFVHVAPPAENRYIFLIPTARRALFLVTRANSDE